MSNSVATAKQKYPRALAIEVCQEILKRFGPACSKVVVAGSLRRRKKSVSDIEILYIPIMGSRPFDLFSVQNYALTDEVLAELLAEGVIEKRTNVNGSLMWGEQNKLARHVRTGIPIDFFRATVANWANYLFCRTGPADLNTTIARRAQERGWKWHPTGEGFDDQDGKIIRVNDERDVFEILGMPYQEPWER